VVCQNIPTIMTGLSGGALVVRTAVRRVRGTRPGRYDGVPRAPERSDRPAHLDTGSSASTLAARPAAARVSA